ncbi:MAG: succinyldiaminopimelate transaminase [Propionibacteriaceae bacterium]|jgi:succinyldiaminopimelate transaminase|nr:succinyldiaminopimelate transaminase [Propionibacteriaceae bacterium]
MRRPVELPDFPWDALDQAKAQANRHPDGIVDLSVGTPVDPTPQIAIDALAKSAQAPGYPQVWGTAKLRESIISYLARRWNAQDLGERNVLPVIGTKELVASLPSQLGAARIVIPSLAYPTYDIGGRLAGAQIVATDSPQEAAAAKPDLIWINSPANPHGRILSVVEMTAWVKAARSVGAVLASDECYGEFGWEAEPVSVLDPRVNAGSLEGLLAVHSLSKRSNAAGYRAGFVAGDEKLVMELLGVRKHSGLMLPTPIQAAMAALLDDDEHVRIQRERYLGRRKVLKSALEGAGFQVFHSEGSLYLWTACGKPCMESVYFFSQRGILVAPGAFYESGESQFVRIALTATDERIGAAAERLR